MEIAICIIAYNRLDSIKRLIKSLEQAYYYDKVTLIISIDKSDTTYVEDFAKNYKWEYGNKRVITHSHNLGLRKHVLECGDLLEEFEALIILEDDVSVAPSFYSYAKQCVEQFSATENIAGISLYNFPINYQNLLPFTPLQTNSDVYLMQCAQSWGQVWMKKQWFAFKKWYLNNNKEFGVLEHLPKAICNWPKSSWLKYHTRYCIEQNKYFIYPYVSLSTNNADKGTHYSNKTTIFQSNLLFGAKKIFNLSPIISYDAYFENEMLYKILNLDKSELCLDFYGEKENRLHKRYWLTRKRLPYRIIKSYSLSLKPYEWNFISNINGNEIFLYDTKIKSKNNFIKTERLFNLYMFYVDLNIVYQIKKQIRFFLKKFTK